MLAKLFLLLKMPISATSPVVPITALSPNTTLATRPRNNAQASEDTKLAIDCEDAEMIAIPVNRRSSMDVRSVHAGSSDQRQDDSASSGINQGRTCERRHCHVRRGVAAATGTQATRHRAIARVPSLFSNTRPVKERNENHQILAS